MTDRRQVIEEALKSIRGYLEAAKDFDIDVVPMLKAEIRENGLTLASEGKGRMITINCNPWPEVDVENET